MREDIKMIGIYMSGTGNTEHCIRKMMQIISPDGEVVIRYCVANVTYLSYNCKV